MLIIYSFLCISCPGHHYLRVPPIVYYKKEMISLSAKRNNTLLNGRKRSSSSTIYLTISYCFFIHGLCWLFLHNYLNLQNIIQLLLLLLFDKKSVFWNVHCQSETEMIKQDFHSIYPNMSWSHIFTFYSGKYMYYSLKKDIYIYIYILR